MEMDHTKEKNAQPREERAPTRWGLQSAEFYLQLRDKPVLVGLLDGKLYKGTLVGVDTYDLIIRQATGSVVLISKGSLRYVTGADAPAEGAAK
jgi:hypothetical protein